ncbi:MAG: DNA-binding protein [Bacteroidaceae bacterium]|nr:DNA-binding protein [Bacteroidaceae bacterium]
MKKIQYSVAMMKNPMSENDPKKAYANLQQTGVVDIDELADHINDHNSVFSKGTIVGILTELGVCMRELILQGYKVCLGTIGKFAPSITSKGASTVKDFTAENIEKMGVNFTPGKSFDNLRRDAQFEKTTSRKVQAAALAAVNDGATTADWSEKEEEGNDEP